MFLANARALRAWPPRRWSAAAGGTALTALAVGVPTVVIPNPWFARMVPVQWWNYPVLAVTAVLGGLLLATYVAVSPATRVRSEPGRSKSPAGVIGGLLSAFAVGCPVCNKLVLLAVGTSGAMNYWAPVQPLVGIASIALLGWALQRRLKGELACPTPASTAATGA